MDHEGCAACGFEGADYDDTALLAALRNLGSRWHALVGACGAELRTRPEPDVWSAIEYAAHSRDITALHVFGVDQALTADEPIFPSIDGEELVQAASVTYLDSDPHEVVDALNNEARQLAGLAADAGPQTWGRGLTVGGVRMDVRRMLEHALHDSLHHVDDVERGLRLIRSRRDSDPA